MSRRCWRPCGRTANVYAAQRSVAPTLANIFLVFDHYLTFWAVPSTFPPSHAAGRSQDRGMESYSNSCKETHVYAKAPFQRSASGRCTIISVRGFRMKYFSYAPSLKTIRQYLFNIMNLPLPLPPSCHRNMVSSSCFNATPNVAHASQRLPYDSACRCRSLKRQWNVAHTSKCAF